MTHYYRITALEKKSASADNFINFSNPINVKFNTEFKSPSNGFIYFSNSPVGLSRGQYKFRLNGKEYVFAENWGNGGSAVIFHTWLPVSKNDVFLLDINSEVFDDYTFYPIG